MPLSKTYIGENYYEALKIAKAELGENLVILRQRKLRVGGFLGLFGGRVLVEVEVQVDDSEQPKNKNIKSKQSNKIKHYNNLENDNIDPRSIYYHNNNNNEIPISNQFNQLNIQQPSNSLYPNFQSQSNLNYLNQNNTLQNEYIKQVFDLMSNIQKQVDALNIKINSQQISQPPINYPPNLTIQTNTHKIYPPNLQAIHDLLVKAECSEQLINKVMNDLMILPDINKENFEKLKEHLKKYLTNLCIVGEPISFNNPSTNTPNNDSNPNKMPKIFAFVGTTGVGKTTTLAKIATNLVLNAKKKVTLFTIDTYRVAATQQINIYADIIGIPCLIIYNESDFLPLIMQHKDSDVILIDTAGRSQRNNLEVLELRKFLYPNANNINIDIFLVISANTKFRDMQDIVKNFSKVNFNSLIFTKTDETTTWGPMLSLIMETNKPVTYISNGQNVPDDIMVAEASYIVKKIIESDDIT